MSAKKFKTPSTEHVICRIPRINGKYTFIQMISKGDGRYHFAVSRIKKTGELLESFLELNEIPIEYMEGEENCPMTDTQYYSIVGAGTAVKENYGIALSGRGDYPYEDLIPNRKHAEQYKFNTSYRKNVFVFDDGHVLKAPEMH